MGDKKDPGKGGDKGKPGDKGGDKGKPGDKVARNRLRLTPLLAVSALS